MIKHFNLLENTRKRISGQFGKNEHYGHFHKITGMFSIETPISQRPNS